MPCVVYMHGNQGSWVDALPVVAALLPEICVLSFDFSGSGLSDGEYVSLGWYERDDLETVVAYLRGTGKISTIGLWGRSMGAVTAIMYCSQDPLIGGMVLDSPFSSLKTLIEELCKRHSAIPLFVCRLALKFIRNTIWWKVGFDILQLETTKFAQQCYSPALICFGTEDDFVLPKHGKLIAANYAGDSNYIEIEGGHNSSRPQFLYDSALIFFHNTL